ncbi:MAG: hypothetical protein KJ811_02625 [Candidatus Margulisbacteria bacterium]|nr:hypothetical protein [Candidatus Margulisiibacteriota bacterium]
MKKYIALITLFVFAICLAGTVYADSRTPAEKLASGRDYLKLLDEKIIKHRNLGNTKVVADLQAQKKTTIARMTEWKAEMQGAPVAPAPPPPPPMAVRPSPAPSAGLFGWGLLTSADIGYIGGQGSSASILAGGSLVFVDPLAMGSMIGLAADAVNYKVGLGLAYGTAWTGVDERLLMVTADGILNLPADMLGGVASYVGGQVNYPVYKSDPKGKAGGLVYVGIKGDLGLELGGDSYAELGYGAILREGRSTKGIEVKFGQEILL